MSDNLQTVQMLSDMFEKAIAAFSAPSGDPMDAPLPCDVTVGHATMRKGVALRTLVNRMKGLYELAHGVNADEVAGRTLEQRKALVNPLLANIPPMTEAEIEQLESERLEEFLACTCPDDATRRLCLNKDKCTQCMPY